MDWLDEYVKLTFDFRYDRKIKFIEFDNSFKNILLHYFIENELVAIFKDKNSDRFDSLINVIGTYELNYRYRNELLIFLTQDWHRSHESIAAIIQEFKMKEIIVYLDEIVAHPIEYLLNSVTDWYGYIRRLFFTLGDINDEECIRELLKFSKNENETIVSLAHEQLKRLGIKN